jgi:signal transduction histidine kinase
MTVRTDGALRGAGVLPDRPAAVRTQLHGWSRRHSRAVTVLAWSTTTLCGAMTVATLWLAALNGRTLRMLVVDQGTAALVLLALVCSAVGGLLAARRPDNLLGWLFCAAAACQGMLALTEEYGLYALRTRPGLLPLGAEATWLKEWIWAPGIGLILVFLPLLFPTGHPPSYAWWPVAWLGGLAIGLSSALLAVPLWNARGTVLLDPNGAAEYLVAPTWARLLDVVAVPLLLVAASGAAASLCLRFRRARGAERQQIVWFLAAVTLTLIFVAASEQLPSDGSLLATCLAVLGLVVVPSIPVATGIAVLGYRLYDIDVVINRGLVYGALVAAITSCYVLAVAGAGALVSPQDDLFVSLIATGIVAVLFAPLRTRLQRAVDRLMHGQRHEPYAVLSTLGRQVDATLEPRAVLFAIADTIARALKLPHVAVELRRNDASENGGFESGAVVGTPVGEPLLVPLTHGGERLGRLAVSPRRVGESFDPAERRLLADLARQAGVAVHAARLTLDLQRSRETLVTAREEERRRLRRTLHDQVGPALSSTVLKLGAVRRLLPEDSSAYELLDQVRHDMRATAAEVRTLAYDLRPPSLDQLGLVAAICDHVERGQAAAEDPATCGMHVDVAAPDPFPALPAAVEVAAYSIAREALTNATRHAGACRVRVRLRLDGPQLVMEVADDGSGLAAGYLPGVGMQSMRERAEELGGTLTVEAPANGGTRVLARLPYRGVAT